MKNYDPRDFYDDTNWKEEIRGHTSNQFELKLLEEGSERKCKEDVKNKSNCGAMVGHNKSK